ncbi:MAG TPA: hypothetical protein VFI29_13345, partial [Hanamia sp.]|nr:hypothetical protein [Hanamia sp.]
NTFFTLCSNNYLAQAKTLGDSLIRFNPGYKFIIGLVDELNTEINYQSFEPYTILPVAQIGIRDFENLWKKYTIVEFNTSVKASYFKYIFNHDTEVNTVCYLDPDISVYYSLQILEDAFKDNNILLTPHIQSPIALDGKEPGENNFLNYGLYNLGFIGIHRNCTIPGGFLDWWEERILSVGFHDTLNGFFVDQLWINFVPLFYEKVKILKNPGLNAAPWNLHERKIVEENDYTFKMGDGSPLYFFHFSNFKFKEPDKMSKYYNRYTFENHPELKRFYRDYYARLIKNKIEALSEIPCTYVEKQKRYRQSQIIVPTRKEIYKARMKSQIKLLVPPLLLNIKRALTKR